MSNENVNQVKPEEYEEEEDEGEAGYYAGEVNDEGETETEPEVAYNEDIVEGDGEQEQEEGEGEDYYRYSGANSQNKDGEYDPDEDEYYYDYYDENGYYAQQDDDGRRTTGATGERYSFGSSNQDGYWNEDWPAYLAEDDQDNFGEDEDLEVASGELAGEEDTIALRTSGVADSVGTARLSTGKSSAEKSGSSRREKKILPPVELGKRSFRWFERKILAQQIPTSEENLRRKRILEKCQMVRKVSKPLVTILGVKPKTASGANIPGSGKASKQSVVEGAAEGSNENEEGAGDEDMERSKTLQDYSEREWAIKNTVDFLGTEGCTLSTSRSYPSILKKPREEADFRLALYERQLQRRRKAIGNATGAPEITAALRRHAERAVWRAVIDNTKPRYPLPRFILPRHRYLKKVQAQFIGPGSYEVDVFESQTKARQMSLPSTWATCTARFPKDKDGDDGKSGKDGKGPSKSGGTVLLDPWTALDKANQKKKYPGTYIPFESTPKNFRKGLMEVGSRVPPNAYNIKSPLEEYIKQRTSTRGPYDCYTPSRGVIPYGYHKSQNDEEQGRLGPGSYEVRTSLVKEMHDSYNFFKGSFGKAERNKMFGFKAAFDNPLWPKEDDTKPAVGQYDPDLDVIGQDKEQNMAPFKVQAGLKKREIKKPDLTAPDYYYFGTGSTWTVEPIGANLASVFRSKTPQIMPAKMHGIRKERNKSSNRKIDLEGLGQGYLPEEHYAYDTPVRNAYALEDCKDPCVGGPKLDPFAIPAYGAGTVGSCCGGGGVAKQRKNCCGC